MSALRLLSLRANLLRLPPTLWLLLHCPSLLRLLLGPLRLLSRADRLRLLLNLLRCLLRLTLWPLLLSALRLLCRTILLLLLWARLLAALLLGSRPGLLLSRLLLRVGGDSAKGNDCRVKDKRRKSTIHDDNLRLLTQHFTGRCKKECESPSLQQSVPAIEPRFHRLHHQEVRHGQKKNCAEQRHWQRNKVQQIAQRCVWQNSGHCHH